MSIVIKKTVRSIEPLIDIAILGAGIWQAYTLAMVFTGASFEQLVALAWVPAICLLMLLVGKMVFEPAADSQGSDDIRQTISATFASPFKEIAVFGSLLAIALAAIFLQVPAIFPIFWIVTMSVLGLLVFCNRHLLATPHWHQEATITRADLLALVAIAIAAVVVVLSVNLPNLDDAYYLNAAVSSVRHAQLPLFSFDGMHGDISLPHHKIIHRLQSYELFVAFVHRLTGLDIWSLYYLWLPAGFAALFSPTIWITLREIGARHLWLGTTVAFIALLVWGDSLQSYGNFGFVRLFQGKGICITLFIPLVTYAAFKFARLPSLWAGLRLTCAVFGAAMFSSTALVIAPFTASIAVAAAIPWTRTGLQCLLLSSLAYLPSIAVLGTVALNFKSGGSLGSEGAILPINYVIGDMVRGSIFLSVVLLLPFFAFGARKALLPLLLRYSLLLFLGLFNGVTAWVLSHLGANLLSWRIYWAAPAALLLGLTASLAFEWAISLRQTGKIWLFRRVTVCFILLVIGFLCGGPWTIPPFGGNSEVGWQPLAPKLDPVELAVARAAVVNTPPDGLVLAPWEISGILSTFPNSPRLIGVRSHYLQNLSPYLSEDEIEQRRSLVSFAGLTTPESLSPETLEWLVNAVEDRQIDTMVFTSQPRTKAMQDRLATIGFACTTLEDYSLCTRAPRAERSPS